MDVGPASAGILLVDDGELEGVARVLQEQGIPFERLRGGQIPSELPPPRDLLIVTPRRVERIRRGSPPDAAPGRPLRIIAVDEDSPAMRRRLRRSGLNLLVRLPADDEIWRLLISRALYQGGERREAPRVAVGSPVDVTGRAPQADAERGTILVDLSNRGCRLRTSSPVSVGDPVSFSIPAEGDDGLGDGDPLPLRGRIRRLVRDEGSPQCTLAVVFDADLPDSTRARLTAMINRWASGPSSMDAGDVANAPSIPACQLPSLPDLMLDDETDPPVHAGSEVRVDLDAPVPRDPGAEAASPGGERRLHSRGRFESSFLAETSQGPVVMIGREISAGGMRIERIEEFRIGDRFRLALHGPGPAEPFVVEAEVARDDGPNGFGLVFRNVDPETGAALEKLVACLPDIESLEEGEVAGLGAILSEIMSG